MMAQIIFQKIAGTNQLYKPQVNDPAEFFLFLKFQPSVDETITLDESWATDKMGYYLFFNILPDNNYADLELALLAGIPANQPDHSSFGWVALDISKTIIVSIQIAGVQKNGSGNPLLSDSIVLKVIKGVKTIFLAKDSPVFSVTNDGQNIEAFNFTYPPIAANNNQPPSQLPTGKGICLPMSGPQTGAFVFESLFDNGLSPSANSWVKDLYNEYFDPLNPFNQQRNKLVFTGIQILLEKNVGGEYSISVYS